MGEQGYILVLREPPLHPHSYLCKLEESFEKPSIAHVYGRDGLRAYMTPPVYDDKYLVIFENPRALESNLAYLKYDIMFPVVVCGTKGELEDMRYLCKSKGLTYKVFENKFEKQDAIDMIMELATEEVPKTFCEALVSRVGLSPKRIISAMMVLEQVGYKTVNISKYVDKYRYTDIYEVIESLLGICKSGAHRRRVALFLHQNRLWYDKYTKKSLLREVDLLLKLFSDITDGTLCEYTLHEYVEKEQVSRYRALYAVDLYESVPYATLLSLKMFLEKAKLLEVVLHLA